MRRHIERNLRATARTPILRRSELIKFVHKPELVQIKYKVELSIQTNSQLLFALQQASANYDLKRDPYVIDLFKQQQNGYDVSKKLDMLFMSSKTYCSDQLRMLSSKASDMCEELGSSAMEWYLHQCMAKFEKAVQVSNQELMTWSIDEKQHLLKLLRELPFSESTLRSPVSLDRLSHKVATLIDTLVAEAKNNTEFTGLVFVEQRVWVATLAEILAVHPQTKDILRIGTFVGSSQSGKRKANIANFAEPRNQQTTLDDFRAGTVNLILATSVLEEGIDISSCHLVICFERPKSLKSFIQRRGRARKQRSKYFIFNPEDWCGRSSNSWQKLEAEMRAAYENDLREVQLAEERENEHEDGERVFQVPGTG